MIPPPQKKKKSCFIMLDAWFQKIILLGYDFFVAAIISQSLLIKYYITLSDQFTKFLSSY